ncbi:MAG TPA: AI-2E family transporter [Thermoanaerobaculia bacterium]|nr:AI-2E family transporter [Thermoanaerobaculia bacterium]
MQDKTLNRYFFIGLLVCTTLLFFWMVRSFLLPVLLAAVFCTLFYPLYERLERAFRGRKTLASMACCAILLICLILPIYGVVAMVTTEAIDFYGTAKEQVLTFMQKGGQQAWLRDLQSRGWVRQLRLDEIDWQTHLEKAASGASGFLLAAINAASRGTLQVVILLFITLFTMFYFFRDGLGLVRRLRYLIPLDREYKNAIAQRFASVARATVRGTLLIALIQGTLSGLTMWIFGVGSPFLWGVVATLMSIIPLVGAWVVLYPAAFIQMATGHFWQGIGILIVTMVVIVNVDNLLRPRLVGQEAGMHDLMVFFSTLGGIAMFGAMGFIIGPLIAALFLAVLDIYSAEFKDDLEVTRVGAALPQLEPPEARHEPVPDPSPGPSPGSR